MRTDNEIEAKIKEVEERDFFGFERGILIAFLSPGSIRKYLIEGITDEDIEKIIKEPTREVILAAIADYMPFALEKAENHRGISASRSISHMKAWFWLLGDEDFESIDWDRYENYGVPILKQILEKYVFDLPKEEWFSRMAKGLPCTIGCEEGCGSWAEK